MMMSNIECSLRCDGHYRRTHFLGPVSTKRGRTRSFFAGLEWHPRHRFSRWQAEQCYRNLIKTAVVEAALSTTQGKRGGNLLIA